HAPFDTPKPTTSGPRERLRSGTKQWSSSYAGALSNERPAREHCYDNGTAHRQDDGKPLEEKWQRRSILHDDCLAILRDHRVSHVQIGTLSLVSSLEPAA